MKNHDINNKPAFIFVLAAIFFSGGLAGLIIFWNEEFEYKIWVMIALAVLMVAGVIFVVYGSLRLVKLTKSKRLKNDPNAFVTDATFIKANFSSYSSSSIGVGGIAIPTSLNVYKKITYEYVDEMGEKHVVKSNLSYFPKQIEYLQRKGTFKIKCCGKYSEIIEELPEVNSTFNL